MKKILLSMLGLFIFFSISTTHAQSTLPNTGAYYSESQKIDVTLPSYVGKLAGKFVNDMDFWKAGLLEVDRYRDEYLVIPSNGLVIPVGHIRKDLYDYTLLSNHEPIDINKYLQTGALSYPGVTKNNYGESGNQVIFAHSSYFENDSGRYKTHFQKIINLPVGTEIWIFRKDSNGKFRQYKYRTFKSFPTKPTNLEILNSSNKKELTLFTCIPIGRTSDRWIVKAEFIEDFPYTIDHTTQVEVALKYKRAIRKLIFKISQKDKIKKEQYILYLIERLEKIRKKSTNKKLTDLIIFLERELEKEYYN